TTVNATTTGSGANWIGVSEFHGLATANALDAVCQTASSQTTSCSITTTANNDIIYVTADSSGTSTTPGYTQIDHNAFGAWFTTAYKLAATVGSYNASTTGINAFPWLVVAFKAPSAIFIPGNFISGGNGYLTI